MESQNFRELYCAKYRCAPADFEHEVLWRCLHPKVLPLARLVWRVNPDHFLPDIELIRHVQETASFEELKTEFGTFCYHHPYTGVLRKNLKVRISGQRLTNLAGRLFGKTSSARGQVLAVHY